LKRVQKSINALGYRKCESAGLLRARRHGSVARSGNIGTIFMEMSDVWSSHPLFGAYATGIEQACQELGFHSLIEFCDDSDILPRCVRERKVDGLLVKAIRRVPAFLQRIPPAFPVVCFGLNDPTASIHQVSIDHQGAGWLVTDYLWSRGHRRIAFLSCDSLHPIFSARLNGYENFLRGKGAFDPALVAVKPKIAPSVNDPDETPPDMTQLLEQVTSGSSAERFTAIVVANDWMACGLYSALVDKGMSIPDEVSVVGFDNSELVCNTMTPPLSSYAAPFSELARAAAMELIDRIEHPDRPRSGAIQLLRGNIVERSSVRSLS
jgi:LacI family transcriptional regulator